MAPTPTWPFKASGDGARSSENEQSTAEKTKTTPNTTSRNSSFPVELPEDAVLRLSEAVFASYVRELLRSSQAEKNEHETRRQLEQLSLNLDLAALDTSIFDAALDDALDGDQTRADSDAPTRPNMMRTENGAPAFVSTQSELLDLFAELEKTVDGERLETLLDAAWVVDPLATLKIMWNARSIHLGKGEHDSFYRCLGWLFELHPATLLRNLPLLYRRVIAKKAPTQDEKDAEADIVMINEGEDESGAATTMPEQRFGISHGYWKDLLNILVLAVRERLDVLDDPRQVLNEPNPISVRRKLTRRQRIQTGSAKRKMREAVAAGISYKPSVKVDVHAKEHAKKESAVKVRHAKEASMYRRAVARFMDPKYRALHLTVARLFAAQLTKDKALLASADKRARDNISLAAKWAPSLEKFHDKQTCIASTIAEIMYPVASFGSTPPETRTGETPRTAHLRVARERYRAEVLAPLRRHLAVVEIPISASAIHTIDYSIVPSIAMNTYKPLFAKRDFERFAAHVQSARTGQDPRARVSGAVLQPAALVAQARSLRKSKNRPCPSVLIEAMTLDAQWNSLVRRVREAGTLPATIAIADVSGSMTWGNLGDKTTPMDTAIGMALLIAEVVPEPFGGSFITFSSWPQIISAGGPSDPRDFVDKVKGIENANWGTNTNFNAVFENLLLPRAIKHKVKPEDMVKTIVVISDMQFDEANDRNDDWEANHERIRRLFAEQGYELPRLVYWHVRASVGAKPITKDTENALLVSGYSQGMLRTFMESGGFDLDVVENDSEEEDIEEINVATDGSVQAKQPQRTRKSDPMAGLWKAIGHVSFEGLEIVD